MCVCVCVCVCVYIQCIYVYTHSARTRVEAAKWSGPISPSQSRHFVARAGAVKSGAPANELGQPINRTTVDWLFMGEEKTQGKTQEQIEEGATKKRAAGGTVCTTEASKKIEREGGDRDRDKKKAREIAEGQDKTHSHVCILPQCGVFCTARFGPQGQRMIMRHACVAAKKHESSLEDHMCRNCHKVGTQCRKAVCLFAPCSRSKQFCKHLHTN